MSHTTSATVNGHLPPDTVTYETEPDRVRTLPQRVSDTMPKAHAYTISCHSQTDSHACALPGLTQSAPRTPGYPVRRGTGRTEDGTGSTHAAPGASGGAGGSAESAPQAARRPGGPQDCAGHHSRKTSPPHHRRRRRCSGVAVQAGPRRADGASGPAPRAEGRTDAGYTGSAPRYLGTVRTAACTRYPTGRRLSTRTARWRSDLKWMASSVNAEREAARSKLRRRLDTTGAVHTACQTDPHSARGQQENGKGTIRQRRRQ